ncbi:unnamed protein product [Phytomonas sp. Hart1]|nr:unnamed protein product [Phytomonas sp. Hart1]|eukprot:CCW67594.1 unnamed protein product [Phytomonas sp. isolate Hart1]
MGQGSIGLVRDTITAEQFLNNQKANHRIVHRAFQKCVVPTSKGKNEGFDLTEEERNCVEEFAFLYAAFAKKNFLHFTSLYEQHQREMYEKARLEYMQQQARQDLKK